MIKIKCIVGLFFLFNVAFAQEEYENELEQLTTVDEQQLRDPVENTGLQSGIKFNLNTVTAEELSSILLLSPQQIHDLIKHRNTYGKLLSVLELQVLPSWDVKIIKQLIPFLYINNGNDKINVKHSIAEGKHLLFYRTGGKPNGYNNRDSWFTKNRQLLNYKFKYKDLFQAGWIIEKDAGEPKITDHISLFFALKNKGIIKQLLIGDFNVNMGQGLVHWQGYAFGRSSNLLSGYRQGNFIQPHTGTDENRFHRGVGLQLKKGKFELGAFLSKLKIDANVISDTINRLKWISSFLLSGIHRTESEIKDKNAVTKLTWGGKIKVQLPTGSINLNMIQTNFSIPVQKRAQPYNQFAISGKQWRNLSIDLALSTSIGFLFSEIAVDHQLDPAFNVGWLKSLDPKFDIAIIYRNMSARYQAFESNCISANSEAGNESGLLLSLNFLPHAKHSLEGFIDFAQQNWPSFTSDRPGASKLFSLQYTWKPNKKTEISTRYQIDTRTNNQGYEENHSSLIGEKITHRWRTHISFSPIESLTIRCRNEIVKVKEEFRAYSSGQLSYMELIYKPTAEPLSISFRYTFFSTDDYSSRVYAYERDLSSYYSIPAHFDQGHRNYLLLQYNYKKAIKIQLKLINDQRREKNILISNQQWPFKNKEWRMQVIWEFGS
ncbi:MAG: hypothetical protein RL000_456 [Bacteroidota bacterium]